MKGSDLRGLRAFGEDYPEAKRILLHRGRETLLVDGIVCAPVDEFLRALHPRHDMPFTR